MRQFQSQDSQSKGKQFEPQPLSLVRAYYKNDIQEMEKKDVDQAPPSPSVKITQKKTIRFSEQNATQKETSMSHMQQSSLNQIQQVQQPIHLFEIIKNIQECELNQFRVMNIQGDKDIQVKPETEVSQHHEDIIPNSSQPEQNILKSIRLDRWQVAISKQKKHKVTFRDQVQENELEDVHIVENWKSYHKTIEDEKICCCQIF